MTLKPLSDIPSPFRVILGQALTAPASVGTRPTFGDPNTSHQPLTTKRPTGFCKESSNLGLATRPLVLLIFGSAGEAIARHDHQE
jgi:hypothetical protein